MRQTIKFRAFSFLSFLFDTSNNRESSCVCMIRYEWDDFTNEGLKERYLRLGWPGFTNKDINDIFLKERKEEEAREWTV